MARLERIWHRSKLRRPHRSAVNLDVDPNVGAPLGIVDGGGALFGKGDLKATADKLRGRELACAKSGRSQLFIGIEIHGDGVAVRDRSAVRIFEIAGVGEEPVRRGIGDAGGVGTHADKGCN